MGSPLKPKTGTQLKPFFYSVTEAAKILGVAKKTVRQWCGAGKLLAHPESYGNKTTYRIPATAIELFQQEKKQRTALALACIPQKTSIEDHRPQLQPWITAMTQGVLTGRPFSNLTVEDYRRHVDGYLSHNPKVTFDGIRRELTGMPKEQYGKRFKFHKAIVSFSKFLIREGLLEPSILDELSSLRPRRHRPPKRLTVAQDELEVLVNCCRSPLEKTIVILLAHTGLRISEFCSLKVPDINLEKGLLTVQRGKGGKTRTLGLNTLAAEALRTYLDNRFQRYFAEHVFLNDDGQPLTRHAVGRRLERLGNRAGVVVTPHALRRAFVTLNANKGRSLVMLQHACGHSDIKTTRSYCLTTEQEVIEAMKEW